MTSRTSSNNFKIRRATQADLPTVARLMRQLDYWHAKLRPDFFREYPEQDVVAASVLSTVLLDPLAQILVAQDESTQIRGMISAKIYDTPKQPQMVPSRRCYVDYLIVEESFQRSKVGQALVEEVCQWGLSCGAQQILLTLWAGNESARAFYEKQGFAMVSQTIAKTLSR